MKMRYSVYTLILILSLTVNNGWAKTYYVDSTNGNDNFTGDLINPFKTISKALNHVESGDTIRLFPGNYLGVITISKSGLPEKPITITSNDLESKDYAIIDGHGNVDDITNYGVLLKDVSWISLEHLKFQNCWKHVIQAENASYISIKNCIAIGGRRFFNGIRSRTHHILIENSYWEQDSRIWTDWGWEDCHDNIAPCKNYNGSFFDSQSGDALGASIIRNNHLKYVFNGIQMWSDAPNRMANIEIYGNKIEYVLDNGIEPELYTYNLHVYHNVFNQIASGIFSFTGVINGPIYVYGNVGYLDENRLHPDELDPWPRPYRIYKMSESGQEFFHTTCYLVHNSWVYKCWNSESGKFNKHIRHYNNIGVFTNGYKLKNWEFTDWDNVFDYDLSNFEWPVSIDKDDQERRGIELESPSFIDPTSGDFRLKDDSPCIDRGTIIPDFTQHYEGSAPDIGAYEGNNLVEGPAFYIMEPPGGLLFKEKPRITCYRIKGSELRVFFSWAVKANTISKESIHLTVNGVKIKANSIIMASNNRELIVNTMYNMEDKDISLKFDPLPTGENDELFTHWGSPSGLISSKYKKLLLPPQNVKVVLIP